MSLIGIYRYFCGYVDISVKGDLSEQFINLCAKEQISVWRIRKNLGKLSMRLAVKDYKKLRKLRKKSSLKFKIKLIKKHGIRFKIHKYRRRKGIIAGVILFFAFLIFMNSFIWNIEVEGNDSISDEKILSVCEELGIYEGVYKGGIDTYNLPTTFILRLDGIAWCSFNIEGSKLTVDISEAKVTERDENIPSNIVAARDGVIEKIEITDGLKAVVIGQAVRKGDLLASGIIDNGVRTYTVKSKGQVLAETERVFEFSVPKSQEVTKLTGKKDSYYVLNFFNLKLPLYLGSVKYDYVDSYYDKNLTMFGGKLPIGLTSRTFEETVKSSKDITEKEAENLGLELLALEAKKLNLNSISVKEITCEQGDNFFKCKVTAKCVENIAQQQEINIDNKIEN